MPTGNWENPQFYGKFKKTKMSISLDSRFVNLENTGLRATLTFTEIMYIHIIHMGKVGCEGLILMMSSIYYCLPEFIMTCKYTQSRLLSTGYVHNNVTVISQK